MSRLTRDATAELSGETKFSGANVDREEIIVPFLSNHEQDWQPYPVDPYSAENAAYTYRVPGSRAAVLQSPVMPNTR